MAKDHDLQYDRIPMIRIPTPNRRVRLVALCYGILLFVWFTVEDHEALPVTVLGWGMAVLIIFLSLVNKMGGRWIAVRYVIPGAVALGVLVGLGSSVTTTGFMFFKNAMHAHIFFDFPVPMLLAILERAPYWGIAGGLVGLGASLAWFALRQGDHEASHGND
jgi:hypothetical protein